MNDEMPRGRNESVSEEDVVIAAREISEPAFGNVEVAAKLPIGPERTRAKLDQLVDKGVLQSKRIGNANVYWFSGF